MHFHFESSAKSSKSDAVGRVFERADLSAGAELGDVLRVRERVDHRGADLAHAPTVQVAAVRAESVEHEPARAATVGELVECPQDGSEVARR